MKKILIFAARHDNLALDEVMVRRKMGYEVYLVGCDETIGICNHNNVASCLFCKYCKHIMHNKFKELSNDNKIHCYSLSDLKEKYYTGLSQKHPVYNYDNIKELKAIVYKNVDIGFGAFSEFATATRNIMPSFNSFFKKYINFILERECVLTDILIGLMDDIQFDAVCFHNGRFPNYKPFCNLAERRGINFVVTELQKDIHGNMTKNYFYNDVPHSVKAIGHKAIRIWQRSSEDKVKVAEDFFNNRRHGKYAGDKIYTSMQKEGLLPEEFDGEKINIAIFNSSEDEYISISNEFDNGNLYENQYTGLKDIFDHYKKRKDIHFYLRIHPNLKKVPYRSHTDLYKLKYDNVTIIPPADSISSYALMDACDKVVVFLSSMGLESNYWGKPVIALSLSEYDVLDLVYTPKTREELWKLIEDPTIKAKNQRDSLIMAYYYMGGEGENFEYFPNAFKTRKFFFLPYQEQTQFRFMRSTKIQGIVDKIFLTMCYRGMIGRFKHLALRTK